MSAKAIPDLKGANLDAQLRYLASADNLEAFTGQLAAIIQIANDLGVEYEPLQREKIAQYVRNWANVIVNAYVADEANVKAAGLLVPSAFQKVICAYFGITGDLSKMPLTSGPKDNKINFLRELSIKAIPMEAEGSEHRNAVRAATNRVQGAASVSPVVRAPLPVYSQPVMAAAAPAAAVGAAAAIPLSSSSGQDDYKYSAGDLSAPATPHTPVRVASPPFSQSSSQADPFAAHMAQSSQNVLAMNQQIRNSQASAAAAGVQRAPSQQQISAARQQLVDQQRINKFNLDPVKIASRFAVRTSDTAKLRGADMNCYPPVGATAFSNNGTPDDDFRARLMQVTDIRQLARTLGWFTTLRGDIPMAIECHGTTPADVYRWLGDLLSDKERVSRIECNVEFESGWYDARILWFWLCLDVHPPTATELSGPGYAGMAFNLLINREPSLKWKAFMDGHLLDNDLSMRMNMLKGPPGSNSSDRMKAIAKMHTQATKYVCKGYLLRIRASRTLNALIVPTIRYTQMLPWDELESPALVAKRGAINQPLRKSVWTAVQKSVTATKDRAGYKYLFREPFMEHEPYVTEDARICFASIVDLWTTAEIQALPSYSSSHSTDVEYVLLDVLRAEFDPTWRVALDAKYVLEEEQRLQDEHMEREKKRERDLFEQDLKESMKSSASSQQRQKQLSTPAASLSTQMQQPPQQQLLQQAFAPPRQQPPFMVSPVFPSLFSHAALPPPPPAAAAQAANPTQPMSLYIRLALLAME